MGLFFSSLWKVPTDVLIAFNKQKKLLYFMVVLLVIGTAADIVLVYQGYGIEGVAIATVVVFYCASITTNAYVLRSLGKSWSLFGLALAKIHLPVVYVAVGLFFIMRFVHTGHVIMSDILRAVIFGLYVVPLIYYVNRKIRIIEKVGQLLMPRSGRTIPIEQGESLE